MNRFCIRCHLALTIVSLSASWLPAQEVAAWGSIQGVVTYQGPKVDNSALEIYKDKDVCTAGGTRQIFDDELVVDEKTQGLRWVAVWVKSPVAIHADLVTAAKEVELANAHCIFAPHILALRKETVLRVSNRDVIAHNAKITGLNNGFNPFIQAATGSQPAVTEVGMLTPESRPILVTCDLHPWMKSYLLVLDHPYYAVTNPQGEFTIPKIPAGKISLVSWHEKFGWGVGKKNGQEVSVEAEKTVSVKLSFGTP